MIDRFNAGGAQPPAGSATSENHNYNLIIIRSLGEFHEKFAECMSRWTQIIEKKTSGIFSESQKVWSTGFGPSSKNSESDRFSHQNYFAIDFCIINFFTSTWSEINLLSLFEKLKRFLCLSFCVISIFIVIDGEFDSTKAFVNNFSRFLLLSSCQKHIE